MILLAFMTVAAAACVWEKYGRLEAVVTALGLAYVFAIAESLD
jgi:hypothetical protein